MKNHLIADEVRYKHMTTSELRQSFLCEQLFRPGEVQLHMASELDRAIIGTIVPGDKPLVLPSVRELASEYFCERRELGVINIGGSGGVAIGSAGVIEVGSMDVLYLGRGSRDIHFENADSSLPARFFLVSFPAHVAYPTKLVKRKQAHRVELGSDAESNRRTIFQYIHEQGAESCQLVMGYTELAAGSVWNTMPPHTHGRRSEVYAYFGVSEGHRVLHLMGQPQETRPLWVGDGDAVLSPPWSIHCGCGTSSYSFVWAMGGENKSFADMDQVARHDLR